MVQNELERLVSEEPRDELQQSDATSLIEGAKRDGLLIAAGPEREAPLLFLHRTSQEYLAAKALARQANRTGWASVAGRIDRWSWHPRWEPVILLLAGQLDDPAPLLELLADEQRDDLFRHRLATAALSLPELSADRSAHCLGLVDQIVDATFDSWWRRWKTGARATVEHLSRALSGLIGIGQMPVDRRLLQTLRDDDFRVWLAGGKAVGALRVATHDVLQSMLDRLDDICHDRPILGWSLENFEFTRAIGQLATTSGWHRPDRGPLRSPLERRPASSACGSAGTGGIGRGGCES